MTRSATCQPPEHRTKYAYDNLGQATSGEKFWPDQTPVAGQQFTYGFDDIGNRTTAASGGNQTGANLRTQNYTVNDLNQYSQRTVPGYATMLGTANSNAQVTLWRSDGSHAQSFRKGDYYMAELPVSHGTDPLWLTLTNLAVLNDGSNPDVMVATVGNEFLPGTPETFGYDFDGNLTSDGRWNYTWDAENRLVSIAPRTGVGPRISLKFEYDWQGRRIRKRVWATADWTGSPTSDVKFVYDGWNLIAELDALNASTLLRSYVWGLDLSGSLQGAGGVGGLLFIGNWQSPVSYYAPAFDGNGNVMALVSMADATVTAQYEYGPFGEVIRATGPMAKLNPFRFSTKYQDDETDLLYYGYRYYTATIGRWLSSDPVEEQGGLNLYGFVANTAVNAVDLLGLDVVCHCMDSYLRENGIRPETYTVSGDTYSAKIRVPIHVPADGAGQILYKMLQSTRTFRVTNLDVNELKRHVQARQNVIAEISNVHWAFGTERDGKFNHSVWKQLMVVAPGVTYSRALSDPFKNPGLYQAGCRNTSMLILLKGIMDTVGASQFNKQLSATGDTLIWGAAEQSGLLRINMVNPGGAHPTLAEWIPGDRGWIKGGGPGHALGSGEYIIYKGGADEHFWGFDDPVHDTTLDGMMDAVRGFSAGEAYETGQRWYPGVGLDK